MQLFEDTGGKMEGATIFLAFGRLAHGSHGRTLRTGAD